MLFQLSQPIFDSLAEVTSHEMTGDNLPRESLNKKPNIKIAKIDATKNKVMADKFSVTSFPTIKYVNNGMLSEYTGIRTKKNFLSFINIMLGDHLIRINSLEDLRTLQLTNILSDTGNSNIIFLLTIYRTENNMKNSMKKNVFTFSSNENKNKSENENENKNKNESEKEYKSDNKNEMINERNSKEIEIENTFSHLAKKLQGKAIFTILYKDIDRHKILKNSEVNNDNEDEDENEKEDIPFQDNDNILSGFYSLSKREINRPPIFLKKQYGIRNKNHNDDNNNDDRSDDNNNNSNNNNNDSKKKNENNNNSSNKNENNISNNNNNNEIISSQLLEGFILSHNRPTISKLSQHNFRDLMDLSKVMVIAVVNGVSTIRINNKNNKDYFSMINNSNNNGNHNNEKNNNNIINNNNNNNNNNNKNTAITTAALWVIADFNVFLLGNSKSFIPSPSAQQSSMVNSFRFMNSDVYFDDKSLTVLLRVLEGNTCEGREKWWTDVRACRRRRQIACDATMPVVTVFNTTTEFQFMEFKAVVERVKWALKERGLLVFDAFRAFNSSNSGLMTCSELYGGLHFLGIPFTPDQVYDLVRKVAVYNEVS